MGKGRKRKHYYYKRRISTQGVNIVEYLKKFEEIEEEIEWTRDLKEAKQFTEERIKYIELYFKSSKDAWIYIRQPVDSKCVNEEIDIVKHPVFDNSQSTGRWCSSDIPFAELEFKHAIIGLHTNFAEELKSDIRSLVIKVALQKLEGDLDYLNEVSDILQDLYNIVNSQSEKH